MYCNFHSVTHNKSINQSINAVYTVISTQLLTVNQSINQSMHLSLVGSVWRFNRFHWLIDWLIDWFHCPVNQLFFGFCSVRRSSRSDVRWIPGTRLRHHPPRRGQPHGGVHSPWRQPHHRRLLRLQDHPQPGIQGRKGAFSPGKKLPAQSPLRQKPQPRRKVLQTEK